MATQLFLLPVGASGTATRGENNAKLNGVASGWLNGVVGTSRGAAATAHTTSTVAGATNGVEVASGSPLEWLTEPLAADVTISGAVTGNIWAHESDMNANVAINFVVDRFDSATGAITQIVKSARTTEVATSSAVNNFTATPGAGVACKRGDRLRIRVFGDDAGTMGTGFTFSATFGSPTAGVSGDTYITFTETFSFESDPAGSVLYLTDTSAGITPGASIEKEAWTSRGASSTNSVTNSANGWLAPFQVTDSAGGTTLEWYSKPLSAFTLGGMVMLSARGAVSNAAAFVSLGLEVAVTEEDGSSPTVLGEINQGEVLGRLTTTEHDVIVRVGVDDTAVTDGQRLRFRLTLDDGNTTAQVSGHTATITYSGTTGGAAGDTFVTLPQTVTEFVGGGGAAVVPILVTARTRP